MYHNLNSGRLRDYVEFYTPSSESDEFGQPKSDTFVFDAMASVKTVKGDKVQDYGTTTTSTIVTILMYYDERAMNDQSVVFNSVEYQVTHVNPDEAHKAMIVTCEVIKK